jgi:hypothetical protein
MNRVEWPPSWLIRGNLRGHNGSLPDKAAAAAEGDNKFVRREYHGGTYKTVMHEQQQEGDPTPHGVPPGYEHPMNLSRLIIEGAPRALPVSQKITHGPAQDRAKAFAHGSVETFLVQNALDGFKDRRLEGRRYRGTDNVSDLEGRQQPYDIAGWQRDVKTTPDGLLSL